MELQAGTVEVVGRRTEIDAMVSLPVEMTVFHLEAESFHCLHKANLKTNLGSKVENCRRHFPPRDTAVIFQFRLQHCHLTVMDENFFRLDSAGIQRYCGREPENLEIELEVWPGKCQP